MPKFFKKNGNGMIEMSVKIWNLIRVILAVLGIIAVGSFTYGSRSATWDSKIGNNTEKITELKAADVKHEENVDKIESGLGELKGVVGIINDRTIRMEKSIDEIKASLKE